MFTTFEPYKVHLTDLHNYLITLLKLKKYYSNSKSKLYTHLYNELYGAFCKANIFQKKT